MARMSVGIMSHNEARSFFINAADRRPRPNGVKIGHNTYLHPVYETAVPSYAIRYHDTDIVTIRPDNTYVLNSGGYRTVTTKQRIASLAPGCLYQKNNIWLLGGFASDDGKTYEFYDGIRIDKNGREV